MKSITIKLFLFSVVILAAFTSCTKDDEPQSNPEITTGMYILNQGKFGLNNSTLTYFDVNTNVATTDIFQIKNNVPLGDTGQDIIRYGSKLYIAMYKSSVLHVINAQTGLLLKTISLVNSANEPYSPRSMATANGKIYMSMYSGYVAQFDTLSLSIEKTVIVGKNPEGIAYANNKIYVANSGGMAAVKDSTVSVIDPATLTVQRNIKVVINPQKIEVDTQGDLYVISNGNYGNIPVTLQRIEAGTEKVTKIPGFTPFNMTLDGNTLYMFSYEYDANWNVANKRYVKYNVATEQVENSAFIASDAIKEVPFSIDVNPVTKDIFIAESDYVNSGKMYCFGADGKLKYTFTTGLNSAKAIFVTNK